MWSVSGLTVGVGVGHFLVGHYSRCGVVHLNRKNNTTHDIIGGKTTSRKKIWPHAQKSDV